MAAKEGVRVDKIELLLANGFPAEFNADFEEGPFDKHGLERGLQHKEEEEQNKENAGL